MKVRFMEYVPLGGNQTNLFFMQEKPDLFSVIVRAKGERPAVFYLQKDGDKKWAITSQNIPEWAKSIESYLAGILEHRLQIMNQPNRRNGVRDHSQIILNR